MPLSYDGSYEDEFGPATEEDERQYRELQKIEDALYLELGKDAWFQLVYGDNS